VARKRRIAEESQLPAPLSARSPALPEGYDAFLKDLKERIRAAQIKAAVAANSKLIELCWHTGQSIVERQEREGWGSSVIERLAKDIQTAFPGVEGFSRSNIWRMRAFFLAYTREVANLAQPVREFDGVHLPLLMAELPWGHNVVLIQKIKDPTERLWYARQAIEHGWSRPILDHQIDSGLYGRQGKAVTNFTRTLPPPQSELADEVLKDPYAFDFLSLAKDARERELKKGLLAQIRHFLLELGAGFAFVGENVHLEVGGDDFYIDMLFYHLKLRAFIVIDLKARPFKPEFAGKMNFYLSAVDDRLRYPDDQPSIGIILCKAGNQAVAEYALRDIAKPIGISTYVTRLVESLPADLQTSLPTVAELEAELQAVEEPSKTKKTRRPKPRR
jgi:predicted nuclease of restriction endonuclease-like (RecB) superfamily